MCGIVAFTGKDKFDPIKIKTIFGFNQHRGFDSWGHCSLLPLEDDRYRHQLVKKIGRVIEDMNDLKLVPSQNFLGHVRARTKGVVNIDNAHPFQYKTEHGLLTGVHNGTVENADDISRYLNKEVFTKKQKQDYNNSEYYVHFDVDSKMLLYSIIALNNYDVLTKIKGGTALVFFVGSKLKVYNNGGRSLWKGEAPEGTYFSSIPTPLEVLNMENIEEVPLHGVHTYKDGEFLSTKEIAKPKEFVFPAYSAEKKTKNTNTGNVQIMGFKGTAFDAYRLKVTKEAIKDQCPFDKVPSLATLKGDYFYDKVALRWIDSITKKPVDLAKVFVAKDLPALLADNKVSDNVYDIKDHPSWFSHGFPIFNEQFKSKYILDKPFYLDGNIEEDREIIDRELIVQWWKGRKINSITTTTIDYTIDGKVCSQPGKKIEYESGLTCTVANNFNPEKEKVISTWASFDSDTDKFVLWTIFEKGSTTEEEIINMEDLYGVNVAQYKADFPEHCKTKEKKEEDKSATGIFEAYWNAVENLKTHNEILAENHMNSIIDNIDIKPFDDMMEYIITLEV